MTNSTDNTEVSDTSYTIDGVEKHLKTEKDSNFKTGESFTLSNEHTDITYNLPWYKKGYTEEAFLNKEEFQSLKAGITECVSGIIKKELSIETDGFSLESYHKFVTSNESHLKIVTRTRDLFPKNFNFPILQLLPRLEKKLGFSLKDINPRTQSRVHIIIRINRPGSPDYNPPHKDIYENFDNDGYIAKFMNFWIPIAGVTDKSSLPLVPESHLLCERDIERTRNGGFINGNRYRVRMLRSWGGSNQLIRSKVKYGEALIFSSHLIHGLAINDEVDTTRVALEFRLFRR